MTISSAMLIIHDSKVHLGDGPAGYCPGVGGSAEHITIFYRRNAVMQLSSPKMITWVIALILGVLGLLASLVTLPLITATVGFWLLVIAWLLLIVGSAVKGI